MTENRDEIEIKIIDNDMFETAKDIGLLVGDEALLFASANRSKRSRDDGASGRVAVMDGDAKVDEVVEASDEQVAAAQAAPAHAMLAGDLDRGGMCRMPGARGDHNILDAEVLEEDAPLAEEEDVDEWYVLEDEDEETKKEEEEDEGLGPLGGGDEDFTGFAIGVLLPQGCLSKF